MSSCVNDLPKRRAENLTRLLRKRNTDFLQYLEIAGYKLSANELKFLSQQRYNKKICGSKSILLEHLRDSAKEQDNYVQAKVETYLQKA